MTKQTLVTAVAAASALTLLFICTTPLRAEHKHPAPQMAEHSHSGVNPLVEEMRRLDGVFKEIVSGVALGDGEQVHRAIEGMHGTMEKTQEALHAGEVKPPKNAGKLEEFERMDKEFHSNLEKLAGAASRNNGKEMLSLTKKLMDGCVGCHSAFRK